MAIAPHNSSLLKDGKGETLANTIMESKKYKKQISLTNYMLKWSTNMSIEKALVCKLLQQCVHSEKATGDGLNGSRLNILHLFDSKGYFELMLPQ